MLTQGRSLVFLGTPEAAATVLKQLVDAGIVFEHVVTRPDAKRGRGSALSPSPVKRVAHELGLSVSHDLSWIEENAHRGLCGIVVAYGRLIPESLLQVVPMVNLHFSLLPRWRGAAPVERALMEGDATTGVCVMNIEPTLDTGAVYSRVEVPITRASTTESLTQELALAGSRLLATCLKEGFGRPVPQGDGATYAAKISREDLRIDWTRTADEIDRQIRAVRAYTVLDSTRLRVISAEVGDATLSPGHCDAVGTVGTSRGSLRLITVQPEGKSPMDAQSWLRGRPRVPVVFS